MSDAAGKVEIILSVDKATYSQAMAEAQRQLDQFAGKSKSAGAAHVSSMKDVAKAQELATKVIAESGNTVSREAMRVAKAHEEMRAAAQNYAKVQTALHKGYLDEASGAKAVAAAYQTLAKAKLEAAEADRAAGKTNAGSLFHERVTEHLGEFGITESLSGGAIAVAGTVAVVGELVNKMREVVTESLEFGEQMQRASEKTGLTVETLSVLHYAAKTTGGDFESMTSAVAKMDKNIGLAVEGNKQAMGLMQALHLNAKQLANDPQGAEIAWKRFTEVMGATEGPIARNTLAQQMLGKAGAEQIPTIIALATHWDELKQKAAETGNLMSGQTARQLAETNEKLKNMQQSIAGAGIAFTEGFTPGLSKMLDVMAGGESHLDLFKKWGDGAARALAFLTSMLYEYAAAAKFVQGQQLKLIPFAGDKSREALADAKEFDQKGTKYADIALGGNGGGLVPYAGKTVNGRIVPENTDADAAAAAARRAAAGFQIPDLSGAADKEAQKRLKAMEANLNWMKIDRDLTAKAEYDYWDSRRNAFTEGSQQYNDIVAKQAELAVAGARSAHAMIAKFRAEQKKESERLPPDTGVNAMMRQQNAERVQGYLDSNTSAIDEARNTARAQESAISEEAGRSLSHFAAALEIANVHTQEYTTTLMALQAIVHTRETEAKANPTVENQRALTQAQKTLADAQTTRQIEVSRDNIAAYGLPPSSSLVGAQDALQEFVVASRDAAAQMRELVSNTLHGVNSQILAAMMGQRTNFKGVGAEVFKSVANSALNKGEASILTALGLGKGPTLGTAANPMYVRMAGAAGDAKSVGSTVASMAGGALGKFGGFVGTVLKSILPGFANGGYVNGPSIVGENGPELFNPSVSGHIIPNYKLTGGGGGGDTHINVDATGSTDPAQTEAAVQRGIAAAAPSIIAASVAANQSRNARLPSSRRG